MLSSKKVVQALETATNVWPLVCLFIESKNIYCTIKQIWDMSIFKIMIKHDTLDILIWIFPSLFSEAIEICIKICLPMTFISKKNYANFTCRSHMFGFHWAYSFIGIVYMLLSVGTYYSHLQLYQDWVLLVVVCITKRTNGNNVCLYNLLISYHFYSINLHSYTCRGTWDYRRLLRI